MVSTMAISNQNEIINWKENEQLKTSVCAPLQCKSTDAGNTLY